jgi:hypothetical protein
MTDMLQQLSVSNNSSEKNEEASEALGMTVVKKEQIGVSKPYHCPHCCRQTQSGVLKVKKEGCEKEILEFKCFHCGEIKSKTSNWRYI